MADDDWPIPADLAERFPSTQMGEAGIAAWMLDCACSKCDRVRAVTAAPTPRDSGRRRSFPAVPTPTKANPDGYPCGHPRTSENSYRANGGKNTTCRACNREGVRRRRAAKRAARQAEETT